MKKKTKLFTHDSYYEPRLKVPGAGASSHAHVDGHWFRFICNRDERVGAFNPALLVPIVKPGLMAVTDRD
jgi:hypothetical protein